jgi:3-hydroxyisobutyrate dehydrogenase-like beta-hydroxyacid dehydrogenase
MNQNDIKVGFIGLGRMGKPMAQNVLKAGYDLTGYDLREETVKELAALGAKPADSPRAVAQAADIIEVVVVDDAQVEQVLSATGGVFEALRPGAIVAIHSTVYPETVRKLARQAEARGGHVIDAPVSGGEAGARARQLCYMVGGDAAIVERCRALFGTSAADIFHLGALGSGAAAKMIVQVVTCLHMLAAHEAEVLCDKAGLDFAALQSALHKSSAQSFVADNWLDRFKLAGDPMAIRQHRTEVFQKSLAPALAMAQELGLSLSGAELAQRLMPQIMGIVSKG